MDLNIEEHRSLHELHVSIGDLIEDNPSSGFRLKLQAWAAEFIELTYLGIPYRIPPDVDGKPTVRKVKKLEVL